MWSWHEWNFTPSFVCFLALRQLLFEPCNQHKYPALSNEDTKLLRWVLWILWSCLQILTSRNYMQWGSSFCRNVDVYKPAWFQNPESYSFTVAVVLCKLLQHYISVTFDNRQSKPLGLDYFKFNSTPHCDLRSFRLQRYKYSCLHCNEHCSIVRVDISGYLFHYRCHGASNFRRWL